MKQENNTTKKWYSNISLFVAIMSIGFAISSLVFTYQTEINKCNFKVEETNTEIEKYKDVENITLLTEALIAEAEGDFYKCQMDKTFFVNSNKKKESIEKYKLSIELFDSLKNQNVELSIRIEELRFRLQETSKEMTLELNSEMIPGKGPVYEAIRNQAYKYEKEIDQLLLKYEKTEDLYTQNIVRLKGKLAEVK